MTPFIALPESLKTFNAINREYFTQKPGFVDTAHRGNLGSHIFVRKIFLLEFDLTLFA